MYLRGLNSVTRSTPVTADEVEHRSKFAAVSAAVNTRLKDTTKQAADLEAFKRQKTNAQLGLALVLLVAAGVVGLRLFLSSRLDFAWDEAGFSVAGRRHSPADVAQLDRSRWESKGILKLKLADGGSVVLDAWHHLGVREAAAELFPLPDEAKGDS